MSHVSYEGVMSHVSCLTSRMRESCLMPHVSYEGVMSHVSCLTSRMRESCLVPHVSLYMYRCQMVLLLHVHLDESSRKKASATEWAVYVRVNCIKDIIYVPANESRILVTHVCIHLQVVYVDTYSCIYTLTSSVYTYLLMYTYLSTVYVYTYVYVYIYTYL